MLKFEYLLVYINMFLQKINIFTYKEEYELDYLKNQIKELYNKNNYLENNINQLKQKLKESNTLNQKLNYFLEITSEKLDSSINKINEQKKIIDKLNNKIIKLKIILNKSIT